MRQPLRISATLHDTDDARALVRRVLSYFPLAISDQSDEADVIRDFKLDLDDHGRAW